MKPLEALARNHALSVALSLRAIGIVSLSAFVSLHVQIAGLFGEQGIDPMLDRVERVLSQVAHPMFQLPSLLLWTGGSDTAMSATCVMGEIASLAMIVSIGGALAPLVAYVAYLSFVTLGAPFLPLQWDTLLTESLVIAAIASPLTLKHVPLARPHAPSPLALFALWLLIGRLMFASGYVKIASGDDAWTSLRALDYHFETQPLPTLPGYAMHFAPTLLRRLGVVMTFIVELVLPFAIFFGTLGRRIAAAGFAMLMSLIAITGNYGFFDFLALALTISLVDDAVWLRAITRLRTHTLEIVERRKRVSSVLAATQMFFGTLALLSTLGARPYFPDFVSSIDDAVDPFRVASTYGLFAVMTRHRPIVIFEGSDDGETWRAYDYRWQSGDPARAPAACMPHMPRLDWMVWFAGLGDGPESWTVAVEVGLLEARPEVLALFGSDPFEGHAPAFVRTRRYDYTFAPLGDEDWWSRADGEPYGPTLQHP